MLDLMLDRSVRATTANGSNLSGPVHAGESCLPWAGVVVITAYAALAAVQSLVLNPLAAVPGHTLDEIHRDLAAAGESMSTGLVIGYVAVGPVVAVVIALIGRQCGWRLSTVVGIHLALLMFGAGAYLQVGAAPAFAIAKVYPDWQLWEGSPWGTLLFAVSAAAAVAGAAMLVIVVRGSSRQ